MYQLIKSGLKTYLSRVKYRESVNKSFVQRGQNSKQPRDPQKRNQHRACLDVKFARRQSYQYSQLVSINGVVKFKKYVKEKHTQTSYVHSYRLARLGS